MKMSKILLICGIVLSLLCCHSTKQVRLASRGNNVCKLLRDNVIVYAIFVDSKYTKPWTEYDINSTLDSLKKGMNWVMQQAKNDTVGLNIQIEHHKTNAGVIPIFNNFSKKTLYHTLYKKPLFSGIKDIYKWADKIAVEAGKSLPKDTSWIIKTPNKIANREQLIARLRDIHKTDNVALMYFINNYHTDEISVAFDISSDADIEFAIVSFKNPAVIAHEFLHLFGAWDLYITPFDSKRKAIKKKKQAMELFPNEIMAFQYRNIESLEISQFTRYAIGWDSYLEKKYSNLLLGKKLLPVKY